MNVAGDGGNGGLSDVLCIQSTAVFMHRRQQLWSSNARVTLPLFQTLC